MRVCEAVHWSFLIVWKKFATERATQKRVQHGNSTISTTSSSNIMYNVHQQRRTNHKKFILALWMGKKGTKNICLLYGVYIHSIHIICIYNVILSAKQIFCLCLLYPYSEFCIETRRKEGSVRASSSGVCVWMP